MKVKAIKKTERIAGFQKASLIDWEGKLASVIFLSGCNWNCPFCHNWELCANDKFLDEEEILSCLRERKGWIDGVVICGGEPTLQKDIIPLTEKLKSGGFKVKVDTNGSHPKILKDLAANKLVDYVAMDIKTALKEEKYFKATGSRQLRDVKESMSMLLEGLVDFEFRTTMVPEVVSEDDILFNLNFIPTGTKYILQQFSNDKVNDEYYKNIQPYSSDSLQRILDKIKQKGVITWLRG